MDKKQIVSELHNRAKEIYAKYNLTEEPPELDKSEFHADILKDMRLMFELSVRLAFMDDLGDRKATNV